MTDKKDGNNRYICFDVLKAICAFMVICMHKDFPIAKNEIRTISVVGVPLFFMISGFFYEELRAKNKIKKQIIKIFKMFVYFSIFYAAYLIIHNVIEGISISNYLKENLTFGKLSCLLLFNYHSLFPLSWYLSALLYTVVIVDFVSKRIDKKVFFYVVPILLIANIVLGSYSDVVLHFSIPAVYTRNYIFIGIPFYSLGMYLYTIKDKLSNCNTKFLFILVLLFVITSIIEYKHLSQYGEIIGDLFFSSIPYAICIFILLYKYFENKEINKFEKSLAYIGRECSMFIYFIHIPIRDLLDLITSKLSIIEFYNYVAPTVIYLCCIMIIYVYKRLKISYEKNRY